MILEPIALAIANRVRGAESGTGVTKILFSIVFALCAVSIGVKEPFAILAGFAMFFAMKPSWGEQIGAWAGFDSWDGSRDTDFLTNLILPRFKLSDKAWGFCGLITRGLYFMLPLLICQLWFAAAFIPFAFALSYVAGVAIEKHGLNRDGWEMAEYIFGLILGLSMVF